MPPVPEIVPLPVRVTVSVTFESVKVALTSVSMSPIVTMQGALPVQGGPQSTVEPTSGVAWSVTTVPLATTAEQAAPQFRDPPPGQVATTAPVPLPSLITTRLAFLSANVAVTCIEVVIPTSEHDAPFEFVHPDHSLKTESAPGLACSTKLAPTSTVTSQEAVVQLMPSPVIVPLPFRWIETVTFGTTTPVSDPSGVAAGPSRLASPPRLPSFIAVSTLASTPASRNPASPDVSVRESIWQPAIAPTKKSAMIRVNFDSI
jgi:hypothetical protein